MNRRCTTCDGKGYLYYPVGERKPKPCFWFRREGGGAFPCEKCNGTGEREE